MSVIIIIIYNSTFIVLNKYDYKSYLIKNESLSLYLHWDISSDKFWDIFENLMCIQQNRINTYPVAEILK